ncbi:unnamed protein product [Didymodactylos carnosus]|uniref:Uncharacterized protein n=1 Tax=Didymodactylos carnosus TaxID=1234261 RepID=A0A814IM89_9BILA|nr:unnamed protein product [Didymodactylos carnosus]CAF1025330.1 unnamed protein product [Didymodactylos carnosus]CAF3742389.1 unnamed protein product [Didymodactylos carnosus]CAF3796535.1 unnamed protein product [Didymodactylos carnosus]
MQNSHPLHNSRSSDGVNVYDVTDYEYQLQIENNINFEESIFPNVSQQRQCYMPNTTLLLENLVQNSRLTLVNITNPHCLAIDDHGYLVTLGKDSSDFIQQFHSSNLTRIKRFNLTSSSLTNFVYHQNSYFIGTGNNQVSIYDSHNFTYIADITVNTSNLAGLFMNAIYSYSYNLSTTS